MHSQSTDLLEYSWKCLAKGLARNLVQDNYLIVSSGHLLRAAVAQTHAVSHSSLPSGPNLHALTLPSRWRLSFPTCNLCYTVTPSSKDARETLQKIIGLLAAAH